MRLDESINLALTNLMTSNDKVYFLGEDILDPYGGAFKISKGLSTKFPERVITTPISEAGIIGLGTGLSMEGFYPIVEIMFGDFLTLGFDQILNSASKFNSMYNKKFDVPLTIRTPMGGGRGYGPTHSQSLESFFMGISGFNVYNLNVFQDIEKTLNCIIFNDTMPKLIVEHKLDYPIKTLSSSELSNEGFIVSYEDGENLESISLSMIDPNECDCTILAYGHVALMAKEIIKQLMIDFEVACNLIIPTRLYPFDYNLLVKNVETTGRLFILEEGMLSYGFGSEIVATIQKLCFGKLKSPITRVASKNSIIPASSDGELDTLINKEKILSAILRVMGIN
ncbi:MAG: alpha-ketoacid dehydrogenase subunit beta [Legionellales bacterium]|nr:alpha-ketoacid dehydrogenase subunit beta [Legionellales bacterium]